MDLARGLYIAVQLRAVQPVYQPILKRCRSDITAKDGSKDACYSLLFILEIVLVPFRLPVGPMSLVLLFLYPEAYLLLLAVNTLHCPAFEDRLEELAESSKRSVTNLVMKNKPSHHQTI